jgi:hypothetical protein
MGFKALVEKCISIEYIIQSEKSQWDYIRESVYIAIHSEVQLNTLFILVDMFFPIKIIANILLKDYARHGSCTDDATG